MARTSLHYYFRILVLITFTIFNPVAGQTDGFLKEPTDVQVRAGETGHLDCVLAHGNDCYWNRGGQIVVINGDVRYNFTGDRSTGDCSIDITNSSVPQDDGIWECGNQQTSDAPGSKSSSARYEVLVPPHNPIITVNGVPIRSDGYIVMNGADSATASVVGCQSMYGKPAANLTWTIATGQKLEGNYSVSDVLNVNNVVTATLVLTTPRDESWEDKILSCVASHPTDETGAIYAYGIVTSPKKTTKVSLTSSYNSGTITVAKNEGVTLSCISDGIPAPVSQLRWRKDSSSKDWRLHSESASDSATNNFTATITASDAQFVCAVSDDKWTSELTSNVVTIVTSNAQKLGVAVTVVYLLAVAMMGPHLL